MFATAGNTTNDGLVGALLNDRFASYLRLDETDSVNKLQHSASPIRQDKSQISRQLAGWVLMALGAWMLVSPQAMMGLEQLKWMHNYAFRGEVWLGVLVLAASLYLLNANGATSDVAKLRPDSAKKM